MHLTAKTEARAELKAGMSLYVSDILESLLDASGVRAAVREHCAALLAAAEPPLRDRLASAAHYVGGKCMGYPAIWFVERALAGHGIPTSEIIDACEPALSVSLTTSIVDDLVDRDETIAPEYAAFLYVLIGNAVSKQPTKFALESCVTRTFLNRALEACRDPNVGSDVMGRRGDRIGHFYRMIAAGAVERFEPLSAQGERFIEAIGRFGQCCGHLDDWIDLETDARRGVRENVAYALFLTRTPRGDANGSLDKHGLRWLAGEMETVVGGQIDSIVGMLGDLDAPLLATELRKVKERLPGALRGVKPHAFAS